MKNIKNLLLVGLLYAGSYDWISAKEEPAMKNTKFIFLAGGSGERLWPLSRKDRPKQLMPFLGNQSLLEQSIRRINHLSVDKKDILVLANDELSPAVTALVGDQIGQVMAEPAPRNTGPAILYACMEIKEEQDPVLVFLPSDHFIPDAKAFCKAIAKGVEYAQNHNEMVLLGLMPTFPATGYGYIQAEVTTDICYRVNKFHEKPTLESAEQYIRRNDMFWNIGIFIARRSVLIQEFKEHAPALFTGMEQCLSGKQSCEILPNISIDYAVMEKSSRIVMIPAGFEWYDVGNIRVFLELKKKFGLKNESKVINFYGDGNLASTSKKLVACIGVDDLCIVETDDVILVVNKQNTEMIKPFLQELKKGRERGNENT